ncbi:hypothetical protein [Spirosoma fluviale]|uniref:Uncharacterized protein n=1 Tax=Spirosoma fluviale TaxID=1597977 RepID=A0A286GW95_9BACT|nr:hypothetical protein [Spirosoma fluviale]SOD99761.1 hypothetical protein SAMN06269250_0150 [Spirosoma fluviale]
MSRNTLNGKRQLLADLFAGNTDSLQQYRTSQQQVNSPYRWIVNDTIAGTVYGVGKDGSQHPLTPNDLAEAPPNTVFQIVDHSGGKRIPEPDEDYNASL